MRGDIIKLNAEDAVARAHIVRMCWDDINTLVVITSEDNSIEVRGDDARRVWETWTADRDTMADLLCDYGRALREIAKLGEWGELGEKVELHGVLLKVAEIAREALYAAYKGPGENPPKLGDRYDVTECRFYAGGEDGSCSYDASKCAYPQCPVSEQER